MLDVEMSSSPATDVTRRSLIRRVVAALITSTLFAVIVIGLATAPPSGEDRVAALAQRLRCPVCQNEAIADSPSETAQQMMEIVREKVALGESDQMIVDYFVARYGQWVLLDPPLSGWFLPLWGLPVIVLVLGLVVIARRRRAAATEDTMESIREARPEEAQRQAELDLDELAAQVETKEISADVAADLSARYSAEKEAAARAGGRSNRVDDRTTRSRARLLTGWTMAVLAIGVVIVMVVQAVEVRGGAAATVAAGRSLEDVTNEEMEAVLAENPDVVEMREALADRYFVESEYEAAIPHYLEVLQQDPQQSSAWARLGWSVYQFGEVDLAIEYVRRSLEVEPGRPESQLYLGSIYLYGHSDPQAALPLLESVAMRQDLPPDIRASVEQAIATARSAIDE